MSFNGKEGEGIPLDTAKDWTAKWREAKDSEDANAFFFGREKLEEILRQEDCMGIRVFFGIDDDNQKALILVGAEANENDQTNGLILDRGIKCPMICGEQNALNS